MWRILLPPVLTVVVRVKARQLPLQPVKAQKRRRHYVVKRIKLRVQPMPRPVHPPRLLRRPLMPVLP